MKEIKKAIFDIGKAVDRVDRHRKIVHALNLMSSEINTIKVRIDKQCPKCVSYDTAIMKCVEDRDPDECSMFVDKRRLG